MMKILSAKRLSMVVCVGVLCYAWGVLVIGNADLLYVAQDFSPWLGTNDYFRDSISHPGGMREWVGEWLTQLFYYPWLGASVLVAMWGGITFLLIKACRLQGGMALLALLPSIALLVSITQLGYWIFCLKTSSYWFGSTTGVFLLVLYSYFYTLARWRCRCVMFTLWVLVGFPMLGWIATLGGVVLLLLTPMPKNIRQWLSFVLPIITAIIIVMLYYRGSTDTHQREFLPLYGFPYVANNEARDGIFSIAPWGVSVSLILLPLMRHLHGGIIARRISFFVSLIVVCVALCGASMLNYRNKNFHAELSMLRAMDEGRWDDLLQCLHTTDGRPTREMVMMKDVALTQKGLLAQEAFSYDYRGINPAMNAKLPIHMVHSASPLIYYWLGLPNYAYMWCMENSIEYGLSPYWLRLFYRCALVSGEKELARKYKALLQTTLFHADWDVSHAEQHAVKRFVTGHNELSNDGGYSEVFLMDKLSREQYSSREGQELALHYAMLMRRKELFQKSLRHYHSLIGEEQMLPIYYQQALLLFGDDTGGQKTGEQTPTNVSDEVRAQYEQYRYDVMSLMEQESSSAVVGEMLYGKYGNTYWWYYDFYTNNKSY
ncbi:MAG: DUF6057 family protein [Prevotella sp.]|nr:DUF6057 family protein [Prevotella sp.]